MSKKTKKRYTEDFKREAVNLVEKQCSGIRNSVNQSKIDVLGNGIEY
jgi:hypothetical protein